MVWLCYYIRPMNPLLNQKFHSLTTRAINALLVLILAVVSAQLLWQLSKPWWPPQQEISESLQFLLDGSNSPVKPGANPEQLAARIANNHIFGAQQAVRAKPVKKIAPQTRLDLKLIGVFENGGFGRAIIEYKKQQRSYGVGSKIEEVDAVVQEIYSTYVVILRNGREEIIELDKNLLKNQFTLIPDRKKMQETLSNGLSLSDISTNIQNFRKEVLTDPESALKKVLYIPEIGPNGMDGYRIVAGSEDRSYLARFGFRNGDLLTAVNGIELSSFEQGVQALYELESTTELSISFQRAGRPMMLDLSLD
mgnify:FL=1